MHRNSFARRVKHALKIGPPHAALHVPNAKCPIPFPVLVQRMRGLGGGGGLCNP